MKGIIVMEYLKVLQDNFEAKDNSFLYYLHEENFFHEKGVKTEFDTKGIGTDGQTGFKKY